MKYQITMSYLRPVVYTGTLNLTAKQIEELETVFWGDIYYYIRETFWHEADLENTLKDYQEGEPLYDEDSRDRELDGTGLSVEEIK